MTTEQINSQTFEETLNRGGILLLDWWAPWCGPCRAFAPTYERVAGRHPDIVFGKVNTEEEPDLAAQFEITAIPTLMVIKDRTLVFSQAGMLPEHALEELVKQARQLDITVVRKQEESKASAPAGTDES